MAPTGMAAGIFHADSAPAAASGPPLLLVHGAGGTHRSWPEAMRALPGRRVIALDLPGHGGSPGPAKAEVAGYARSVLGLLDALRLGTAAVAGHSMGGAVALTLALEAPARVAALCLVGTGARLRVSQAILQATADPPALARAADSIAAWSLGPSAGEALQREVLEGLLAAGPGVVHGDFAACNAFDVMGRLGEIRVPSLVVCGAEDRLTPPKYSEFLRDRIAGARLELIQGAGHMVMLEAPGAVARLVEGFLATL
ncbi:MAG TPA: alpha/beta fold hydrolase [Anaeromyxobacteraceae bacterium]|nr:alpha/beta fold hydrolase [Anaeromyxobacteraceae bacterium]